MELATRLDDRLWQAVSSAYEQRNFTTAILDGMHFLGQLIRDRSGLDGDGQSLVGSAFGGANPLLKVNQLQTDSDWNLQRGVEALLRGLYQAIRNPRSHAKFSDTQEDAQALLLFINYLIGIIDRSRSPFEKEAFKKRVFDPEFPENGRYAELLVQEVPTGQRYSVLVEVFRDRVTGSEWKLPYFFSALLAAVTDDEREQFLQVVSEELKITDSDDALRTIRCILPESYWPRLTEIARLRAEGMFLRAVRSGRYDTKKGRCLTGALGAWLSGIEHHVCDTGQLESLLAEKLTSEDPLQRSYVLQFFFSRLPVWVKAQPFSLGEIADAIEQRLKAGDESVNEALTSLLARRRKSQTEWWQTRFKEALESFVPASMQFETSITDDDVPFCITDDDVPF